MILISLTVGRKLVCYTLNKLDRQRETENTLLLSTLFYNIARRTMGGPHRLRAISSKQSRFFIKMKELVSCSQPKPRCLAVIA